MLITQLRINPPWDLRALYGYAVFKAITINNAYPTTMRTIRLKVDTDAPFGDEFFFISRAKFYTLRQRSLSRANITGHNTLVDIIQLVQKP